MKVRDDMTEEISIEILKDEIATYNYNLYESPGSEYLGQATRNIYKARISALEMAIKALEQEPILDKIMAEIADEKISHDLDIGNEILYNNAIDDCLKIIDKYRQEG